MSSLDELLELPTDVVARARARGADVAEAVYRDGSHLTARVRMRAPELVEEAGSRSIGLRVMVGRRVALTSSSDLTPSGLERLVDDAIELASLTEEDPFAGAPDAALLSSRAEHRDLGLFDERILGVGADEALGRALAGETAAFEADARITNSEGASCTRTSGRTALVTSGGFSGTARGTYLSIVVSPVADDEGGKKRSGYAWDARRRLDALRDASDVGRDAARKTVRKLGATKIPSEELPVVFDPDAGRSIVGLVASCVVGSSIWRKSSYLVGRLGTKVASDLVEIVDDPTLVGAPGSRAFDGEGLISRPNVVVDRGTLATYLLDSYSGRKLGLPSTGSASRGGSGGVSPGTSNFVMRAGTTPAAELVRSTRRGLYVTEMMGYGFNAVTGDFSRGASGFLIVDGELGPPVSEVTISLGLDEILKRIDGVGDDLDLRSSVAAPTFRVAAMTVAGS